MTILFSYNTFLVSVFFSFLFCFVFFFENLVVLVQTLEDELHYNFFR